MGACTSGGSKSAKELRATQQEAMPGSPTYSTAASAGPEDADAADDEEYIYDGGMSRARSFIQEDVEHHYRLVEQLGAFIGLADASYPCLACRSRSVRHSFQGRAPEN